MIITNDYDDDVHLGWVGDQGAVAGGAVPGEALEAVTRVAGVALTPAWPQCAVITAAECYLLSNTSPDLVLQRPPSEQ